MTGKIFKGKNSDFAVNIQNVKDSAVANHTIDTFYKIQESLQNFDFVGIKFKNAIADFKGKISISSAADLLKYAEELNLVRQAKLGDKEISDEQKQSFEGKAGFKGLAIFILIKIAQDINKNYYTLEEVLKDESIKEYIDKISLEKFKEIVSNLDNSINIIELYELIDDEQIPRKLQNSEPTDTLPKEAVKNVLPQLSPSSFIEILGSKEESIYNTLEAKSKDDDNSDIYNQPFEKFKDLEAFSKVNNDLLCCNNLAEECFLEQDSFGQAKALETAFVDYYHMFFADTITSRFSELFQGLKDSYNNTNNRTEAIDKWVQKYCNLKTSSRVDVVQESQLHCKQMAQSIEVKFNEHYNVKSDEIGNDATLFFKILEVDDMLVE